MNIPAKIAETKAEIARLQARLEVLEELAGESRDRRAGTKGRKSAARRGKRAKRGGNQQRVLNVLTGTPTRASEIARSAKITQQGTTQVLKALIGKGLAKKTGRGMYQATSTPEAAPKARTRKASKPKEARRRAGKEAKVTPEEVSAAPAQ